MSSGASMPTDAAARRKRSFMRASMGVAGTFARTSMDDVSPRPSPTWRIAARTSRTRSSRPRAARRSSEKTHSPGTTFFAPGRTAISPTVPTASPPALATASTPRARAAGTPAAGGAGPEGAAPDPRPFLGAPADPPDGRGEGGARIEQGPPRLDRAQHPERAVEAAALGHRVEVRADGRRGAPLLEPRRLEARPQVRGGVAPHRRPARPQPAAHELARQLLVLRQAQPRDRITAATDPRELRDSALEARPVAQRTRSASASAENVTSANTSRSISRASGIARSISVATRGCRRAVSRARSTSGWTP